MAIQQYMGTIKVIFCSILVFHILVVVSSEEKKTQEELISQLFDPTSGLLTEDTVRLISLLNYYRYIYIYIYMYMDSEIGYSFMTTGKGVMDHMLGRFDSIKERSRRFQLVPPKGILQKQQ